MNWGRGVVSFTGNAMKVDCYCQIAIIGASRAHTKAPWSLIIITTSTTTTATTTTTTCLRTGQCHKYKTLKLTPSQATISAAVGARCYDRLWQKSECKIAFLHLAAKNPRAKWLSCRLCLAVSSWNSSQEEIGLPVDICITQIALPPHMIRMIIL